ncbi:hypothetical protein [Rhodococcus koreensis]|uniref:hypothetical protein n=1 Tax=Rhodococcus koreensis TaxID=99653 RepID=UPI00198086E7|nr:hypothetical protein [Rhodococcus koreensis]QSE84859.1 hypothetical protein JWS14_40120 [Rhodococcus koreensis]
MSHNVKVIYTATWAGTTATPPTCSRTRRPPRTATSTSWGGAHAIVTKARTCYDADDFL